MGWDAYATENGGKEIKVIWGKIPNLQNKEYKKVFEASVDKVLETVDEVDWLLSLGGLDCSCFARKIEEVTGKSCWNEDGYTPEEVKEMLEDFVKTEEPYDSAYAFVESCAKLGLGMGFSY